jgi:hypothetical protein
LLLIRLSVAATFIVHGWQKIGNMEGTIGFFASLGFGAALTYAVAATESLISNNAKSKYFAVSPSLPQVKSQICLGIIIFEYYLIA